MSNDKVTLNLDYNVTEAIKNYFLYGLHPGSFAESLLRKKVNVLFAHELIRNGLDDYMTFVSFFPEMCTGKNFDSWQGYEKLSEEDKDELRLLLTLQYNESLCILQWMYHLDHITDMQ